MNVTGRATVFVKEHQGRNGAWKSYTTAVSNKDESGNWDNDYYEVVFVKNAKGYEIANKTKIDILDGWLSCRSYQTADGEKKIVSQIKVSAFNFVEEPTARDIPSQYEAVRTDDIPF